MRRLLPLIACVLVLIAGAPAAAAAKPKSHKHSSTSTSNTLSPTPPGSSLPAGKSASAHSQSGALPYTGLDLWASAAVGVGLLGGGLVLRRLAQAR